MGFMDILKKGYNVARDIAENQENKIQEHISRYEGYDQDRLMKIYQTGSFDAKIAAARLLKQQMNGDQQTEDDA